MKNRRLSNKGIYLIFFILGFSGNITGQTVSSPRSDPNTERLIQELQILKDKVQVLEAQLNVYKQQTTTAYPDRIQELDQQVKILQCQRELELETSEAAAKAAPVLSAGKSGFSLKSADNAFHLKLRGYIQADSRFFLDDDENILDDTFLLRRVRPIFEGTLYDHYSFRVMPDFAGGSTTLQEAHIDITYWPEASLRFGKFKAPVGLERLQSATNLSFIERGFPTSLLPNRDVGIQLYGDFYEGQFSYALGVFNGVPDGGGADLDIGDGKDFAGRIFSNPFINSDIEVLQGLGVGISGTYGDRDGSLPSYRSPGQARFFQYASTALANGTQFRISPQGFYYWGSFGLLGEYALSTQEVQLGNVMDEFENEAWQIQATYVLTGEKASYRGVKPARPFDLSKGQWGAFELAARYGHLDVDDDVFTLAFADSTRSAGEADEYTLGLNWYLNDNTQFKLNYAHTEYEGGNNNGDRSSEDAILSRVQVSF